MTTVIDHHVDQLVDSLKALEALMMQPESLHLLSTHQAMERLHAALPLLSNANIAFAHLCERDGAGRLVGANHPVEYLTKQLGLPRADAFSLLNQAKTMFGEVEVPTIEGRRAKIAVPAGTQTGKQIRLKGKGMSELHGHARGDMFVEIVVETPVNLTKRQQELLREFEKAGGDGQAHQPESEGFFAKVKELWDDLRD